MALTSNESLLSRFSALPAELRQMIYCQIFPAGDILDIYLNLPRYFTRTIDPMDLAIYNWQSYTMDLNIVYKTLIAYRRYRESRAHAERLGLIYFIESHFLSIFLLDDEIMQEAVEYLCENSFILCDGFFQPFLFQGCIAVRRTYSGCPKAWDALQRSKCL